MSKQFRITRKELNAKAKEQGIPYYYDYTKFHLMKKLGILLNAKDVRRKITPNVSRAELNIIARDTGIKKYYMICQNMILRRNSSFNYQDQDESNQKMGSVENQVKLKF